MQKNKLIVNDLTFEEVGLLFTSLKTTLETMKELEVPEYFINLTIPLLEKIKWVLDKKIIDRNFFNNLVEEQLDDVSLASEIITKCPEVEIPEYK